jgi:hypothetical protein
MKHIFSFLIALILIQSPIWGNNWIGSYSNDWHNPLNWSENTVPDSNSVVMISGVSSTPIISNTAYGNRITIKNGAHLTINSILNVKDKFIIEASNVSGTGTIHSNYDLIEFSVDDAEINVSVIVRSNQIGITDAVFSKLFYMEILSQDTVHNFYNIIFEDVVQLDLNLDSWMHIAKNGNVKFEDSLNIYISKGTLIFNNGGDTATFKGIVNLNLLDQNESGIIFSAHNDAVTYFNNEVQLKCATDSIDYARYVSFGYAFGYLGKTYFNDKIIFHEGSINAGVYFRNVEYLSSDTFFVNSSPWQIGFFSSYFNGPLDLNIGYFLAGNSHFQNDVNVRIIDQQAPYVRNQGGNYFGGNLSFEIFDSNESNTFDVNYSSPDSINGNYSIRTNKSVICFQTEGNIVNGDLKIKFTNEENGVLDIADGELSSLSVGGNIIIEGEENLQLSENSLTLGNISCEGSVYWAESTNIGNVLFSQFRQNGTAPNDLKIKGGGTIHVNANSEFNSDVDFTAGGIILNGGIFHGKSLFQNLDTIDGVYSARSTSSIGGNHFYQSARFVLKGDDENEIWELASYLGDQFTDSLRIENHGMRMFFFANKCEIDLYGSLIIQDISANPIRFANQAMLTFRNEEDFSFTYNQGSDTLHVGGIYFRFTDVEVDLKTHLNIRNTLIHGGFIKSDSCSITLDKDVHYEYMGEGYFDLVVVKHGNADFTIPLGKDNKYAPVSIYGISDPDATFRVQFKTDSIGEPSTFYDHALRDSTLDYINKCGYWEIEQLAGSDSVYVQLGWSASACASHAPEDINIAAWGGTQWEDLGNSDYSGESASGTVKAAGKYLVNEYEKWGLGGECGSFAMINGLNDLFEGHNNILEAQPNSFPEYNFYINDVLKQSGVDHQFISNELQDNDSIKVEISDGNGCQFIINEQITLLPQQEPPIINFPDYKFYAPSISALYDVHTLGNIAYQDSITPDLFHANSITQIMSDSINDFIDSVLTNFNSGILFTQQPTLRFDNRTYFIDGNLTLGDSLIFTNDSVHHVTIIVNGDLLADTSLKYNNAKRLQNTKINWIVNGKALINSYYFTGNITTIDSIFLVANQSTGRLYSKQFVQFKNGHFDPTEPFSQKCNTFPTTTSTVCVCDAFTTLDPNNKYQTMDFYNAIDDFIPEKEIKINIIVIQNSNIPDLGNFNETDHNDFLLSSFNYLQESYITNAEASDPVVGNYNYIDKTYIRPLLNEIYYFDVANINPNWYSNAGSMDNIADYFIQNIDCNFLNYVNVFMYETPFEGWGHANTPRCNKELRFISTHRTFNILKINLNDYIQYVIDSIPNYTQEDMDYYINAAYSIVAKNWGSYHLAHELAHNFDLLHIYPDLYGTRETNLISHPEFLDDVFDPSGVTHNHTLCGLDSTHVCYEIPCDRYFDEFFNNYPEDIDFKRCSNNIMGTSFLTNPHFSKKQIGKMHRTFSLSNNRHLVANCPYSPVPIEIEEDETWTMDIRVYNDIVVKSGNTMTVSCRIEFPDDARIIVEPGAKLIIEEGAILTSSCKMWKGIRVMGLPNVNQGSLTISGEDYIVNSSQGFVHIKNGALIENAHEGVFMGTNYGNNDQGGIIRADGAIFKNCFRAIAFNPYKYNSISEIWNCEFICDRPLNDPVYKDELDRRLGTKHFVTLWGINGVKFVNNLFENTIDYDYLENPCTQVQGSFDPDIRGYGIKTFDANFRVIGTNSANENTRNVFRNLTYGIVHEQTFKDNSRRLWSYNSLFDNVQYGVYAVNSWNTSIINNDFNVPGYDDPLSLGNPETYGVYAFNYQNLNASGNQFNKFADAFSPLNRGLITRGYEPYPYQNNSYTSNWASVAGNSFDGMKYAFQAERSNYNARLRCNTFDHTQSGGYPWHIAPQFSGYFPDQGEGCFLNQYRPGNYFLEEETEHIFSNAWNPWVYYGTSVQGQSPLFATPALSGFGEPCPTNTDPCTSSPSPWTVVQIYNNLQSARLAQTNLVHQQDSIKAILDQGKTTQMVNLVEDLQISQNALVDSLMLHQPLSDAVLLSFTERDSLFSNTQVKMLLSPNLPLNDSLVQPVFEFIDRRHKNIKDTLFSLHVYNDSYTTIAALERLRRNEVYIEKESIYHLETMFVDSLEFDKLLYLYRDTLADAPEYKVNLLATYLAIDSVVSARSLLNQLALDENISEAFVEYYDLVITMQEDTLTWLQIDSASVLKLKSLAQSNSDIALYALSALELRGDTLIKRHPEDSYGGYSQRLSFFEEETKPIKIVSKLEIYPNPGKGDFNLRMNGLEGLTDVSVYDLSGRRLLFQRVNFINNNPIQLSMNGYNSGIYFVELRQNGVFQSAGKLIIE